MSNGKTLITMDGRNVVLSVVQDRSKIQTLTPTVFKMTTTQQQPTAEKSVQTSTDANNSTTLVMTNTPVTQLHTENTTAEVANTLVSMATGRQRATAAKQYNVVTVSSGLPILSLADYTTTHGVPTATALANQAKLTPTKSDNMSVNDDDDDDASMSTDDYNQNESTMKSRTKSTRGKSNKSLSKANKEQGIEPIQYGPILVKPRKSIAPTLANGRKSKDEPLPPDEEHKRQQRRDRNKQAAAKCRRKRNDLREELEKDEQVLDEQRKALENTVQSLAEQKNQLELLLRHHPCTKTRLPVTATKVIPTTTTTATILDSNNNNGTNNNNNKRVTLNLTNAQNLLAVTPLTRIMTTDGSTTSPSSTPMITIHITPEVAQALLNSASVDKTKLAELLQQSTTTTTAQATTDSNPSMNSTS